jgi:hypothetical protein
MTKAAIYLAMGIACWVGQPQLFDPSHAAWTKILQNYVKKEVLDFARLKKDGAEELRSYLFKMEDVRSAEYRKWSKPEKMAYWINAYNAYATQVIVDHYPIESIQDIGPAKGVAFKEKMIPTRLLGTKNLSLDDVENLLRKKFRDPRIHFALVCGAVSCPVLSTDAYQSAQLDEQLEKAAKDFINDPRRNRYYPSSRTLKLSPIFQWYREDFERTGGKVTEFIARYIRPEIAAELRKGTVRIEYLEYNWCLSGRCPL